MHTVTYLNLDTFIKYIHGHKFETKLLLLIRVVLQSGYIFKNYIAAQPVLTVEAYCDFKELLLKHGLGLGLPTAIKRRLESINFSKSYAHS